MAAALGAVTRAFVGRPDVAVEQRLGEQPSEPLGVHHGRAGAADVPGRLGIGDGGTVSSADSASRVRRSPARGRRDVEHGLLQLGLRQRERERPHGDPTVGVGGADVERTRRPAV